MPEKITLQEIARTAGVSLATASRALNKTGRVGPEVERRVQAAVSQLGSNRQRNRDSRTLCFLLANRAMLHPFHANVLMGAHEFAVERDTHILFYPFHYDLASTAGEIHLPLLFDRRGTVDGVIVGGLNSGNLLELLSRIRMPFSVLGNNVLGSWNSKKCDVVWMDEVNGAYEEGRYLQSLGHQAIWFIGSTRFPVARLKEGYCLAMKEAGLEPRVVESDSENERDAGYLSAMSLFRNGQSVSAIFAYSDTVAHGVYEAALASGLRIPNDISVSGFGDRPESLALFPSLTTVWGYPSQVGRRLAELVMNRIEDRACPPQNMVLPTRLVKRDSCTVPRDISAAHARAESGSGTSSCGEMPAAVKAKTRPHAAKNSRQSIPPSQPEAHGMA